MIFELYRSIYRFQNWFFLKIKIELIDWKGECIGPDDDEENDAIVRYVIEKGQEHLTPDEDSTVEGNLSSKINRN